MSKYIVEPFLYRDIIIEKSDNIVISMMEPAFEQTILEDKIIDERIIVDGYPKMLLIDGEYRLYYRGLIHPSVSYSFIATEDATPYECFCLLTSKDGLNFEKVDANFVDYKNSKSNNILRHDLFCHNFFPYYDENKRSFIGLSGTGYFNNGLFLFNSCDGINWDNVKKIIDPSRLLPGWCHSNHFDSHNSILYNEGESRYYLFIRNNKPGKRWTQYFFTKDFTNFSYAQNITVSGLENQIYNIGAIVYPGNNNLFIGMSMIGCADKKNITILSSKNLHDWNFNNETFFDNIDDSQKFIVNGIVPSSDNKKMYIYLFENIKKDVRYINCYSFRMNRFQKIVCDDNNVGYIKTDLIKLTCDKIFVNFETLEDGFVQLELINENFETVLIGKKMSGNELELENKWDVERLFFTEKFYIKFIIFKATLYSFSYK